MAAWLVASPARAQPEAPDAPAEDAPREEAETADEEPADDQAADEPAPDEPAADEAARDARDADDAPLSDEVELSPEELAAIEAAIGADQAGRDATDASTGPSAPTGAAATVAALLPDISVILDVALAYFSSEENFQTGAHDPLENGFNLQQLELSINKTVDPYFRFDSNIVFALFGVEIEEAYATTLALPWGFQARAGQFLTHFGRLNPTHPHSWDFADQPFMLGKVFGAEGNRGLGAELSWLTPLPWFAAVVFSTTDAAGEATARSFYGPEDGGVNGPLDLQHTLAIEQFFELDDDWSLLWGLSGANGPNSYGRDTRTDVYGTDVYLKYRPITRQSFTTVSLQAEWLYRRRQVPFGLLQDTGGYAYVLWRFAQRWATAARYEWGSATLDRNGDVAIDPLDPAQVEDRHRGTVNLTFWPTEFSRLRLQGSGDFPGWAPEPIWAAFLAAEVVVGSHGAHAF